MVLCEHQETQKHRQYDGGNVPVSVAARAMRKDPQFVRVGLQNGKLPFGAAFKKDENQSQYDYYISPRLFYDYTGYLYDSTANDDTAN